jgi:hypothetical protein
MSYGEVALGVECALPVDFEPRRRAQPEEKGGREIAFRLRSAASAALAETPRTGSNPGHDDAAHAGHRKQELFVVVDAGVGSAARLRN